MPTQSQTLRIETLRFVAGVVIERGIIVKAAPCFAKYIGWSKEGFLKTAQKLRWKVQELGDYKEP